MGFGFSDNDCELLLPPHLHRCRFSMMKKRMTAGEILLCEYLKLMRISMRAMPIRFCAFFGQPASSVTSAFGSKT